MLRATRFGAATRLFSDAFLGGLLPSQNSVAKFFECGSIVRRESVPRGAGSMVVATKKLYIKKWLPETLTTHIDTRSATKSIYRHSVIALTLWSQLSFTMPIL